MFSAARYARNPLAIIALFIVLIYALATVALGIAQINNTPNLEPLIWFLVAFPVVVFIGFVLLVIFWPTHLYGPGDFQQDRSFLDSIHYRGAEIKSLTFEEQERKLAKEIREEEKIPDIPTDTSSAQLPQTKQSRISENEKADYALAEILGLKKFERDFKSKIRQGGKIKSDSGITIPVDGFEIINNKLHIFEVKFTNKTNTSQSILDRLGGLANRIAAVFGPNMNVVLNVMIVTSFEDPDATYKRKVEERVTEMPKPIPINVQTISLLKLKEVLA